MHTEGSDGVPKSAVLIIGSGGREHAIAWKAAQSSKVAAVYAAPGNGGVPREEKCENVPISLDALSQQAGQERLIDFARQADVRLTIVGPEAPLTAGIVDRFRASGLAVVGPNKAAARLEGSKVFAKSFMEKYGVRTPRSRSFSDYKDALLYTAEHFQREQGKTPLVLKADGLAAGKGVIIARQYDEAAAGLGSFMQDALLGDAGKTVVLEEFVPGKEVSILAAVSVSPDSPGTIAPFLSARDHKRRFEGAQGPNTGGMGAIAPVPDFSPLVQKDFQTAILEPTLRGMEQEGLDYRGFIFFGLMVKDERCYLLEYNVRLGDPETQALVPLMDFDLTELCFAMLDNTLRDFPLNWKAGSVCAPVAVAQGYPGAYSKGDRIDINQAEFSQTNALLFIAGAEAKGETLFTAGGRVLAVSASGTDSEDAWEQAYRALGAVSFEGMDYRRDIGRE
ncbi:MAG: phosphoribosylamine--glycine ligase [Treponema sp.]|jgi:phosphoribosylamine--glycine ligase|nr:phosphoribosylamine--glycine ligase [Treponema sp.]